MRANHFSPLTMWFFPLPSFSSLLLIVPPASLCSSPRRIASRIQTTRRRPVFRSEISLIWPNPANVGGQSAKVGLLYKFQVFLSPFLNQQLLGYTAFEGGREGSTFSRGDDWWFVENSRWFSRYILKSRRRSRVRGLKVEARFISWAAQSFG